MITRQLLMQGTPIKKIVKYATARGFTDVAVFNENKKHVNGLLLIHLPAGPTAHFKLSSLKLSKDIKVGAQRRQPPDRGPIKFPSDDRDKALRELCCGMS